MVILTDTNIIIEHLRVEKKETTTFHKLFITERHISAITLITVSEIWQGRSMEESKNRRIVEELLLGLQIIVPNLDIAKKAGDLMRESNYRLNFPDGNIAACAIYYNLPLLSKNKKDFAGIKGLRVYSY